MTGRRKQTSACRICDRIGENEFYTVREMMFGTRDRFDYFQCSACGCLQIADIPADIARYYPSRYYSFTPKRRPFQHMRLDRLLRRIKDHYTVFDLGLAGRFISTFSPNKKLAALSLVRLNKDSRVLDVGCGDGWRLCALREIGFRNLLGVDPFIEHDIEYENGVKVLRCSVRDVTGDWDLVMYHHSYEHVPEPLQELNIVAQLLASGGCCLIRVPTVSSFAWEEYRENWFQLDAPRHYYLHSIKSIELLAEKAGFELRNIIYDSTKDQFQGSELYKRGIPLSSGACVFSSSQIRRWKQEAKKLNREQRGDQAVFYLIKK